jgi:hypothetical protein
LSDPAVVSGALFNTLSCLSESFAQDELAYLALTSKVEQPIRDRLAWGLQSSLGEAFVVSREWRRADLAVLRSDVPLVQVEAKAMYAFDLLSSTSRAKYLARLTSDGLKMAALVPTGASFLLALITHVDGEIAPHLRQHVVKYSRGIRAAILREAGDAALVKLKARQLWESDLAQFTSPWQRISLQAGRQWETQVDLDAYLVGPLASV